MPTYIDHHKAPKLTPEQAKQVEADIKSGKRSQGIRPVGAFIGKNDAWCVIEAPNPQVVHDLHKSQYGIEMSPGDVTEVQALVA